MSAMNFSKLQLRLSQFDMKFNSMLIMHVQLLTTIFVKVFHLQLIYRTKRVGVAEGDLSIASQCNLTVTSYLDLLYETCD